MAQKNKYHFACTNFSADDVSQIKYRMSRRWFRSMLLDLTVCFLGIIFILTINLSLAAVVIFLVGMAALLLSNVIFLVKTKKLKEKELIKILLKDTGHSDSYMSILCTKPRVICLIQTRPINKEDVEGNRQRWFQLQSQYDIPITVSSYIKKLMTDSPQKALIYMDVIEEQLECGNVRILDGLMEDGSLKYYQFQEGDSDID